VETDEALFLNRSFARSKQMNAIFPVPLSVSVFSQLPIIMHNTM